MSEFINNSEIVIETSIRIILINSNKEILLMCADDESTKSRDGIYYGKFWFLIGGKVDDNESLLEAAKRELFEETGIPAEKVVFGPIVWYGEFKMFLSGILKHIDQKFIVAHIHGSANISKDYYTESEKKIIKAVEWFCLSKIKDYPELIYPVVLKDHLPPILEGIYPEFPIWIDIGKQPNFNKK